MKNLLRKLHLVPNEVAGGSSSSKSSRFGVGETAPASDRASPSRSLLEQKPLSGLAGWLSSVASKQGSSPQAGATGGGEGGGHKRDSGSSRDPELEEEYQIQVALELSAREDPEAVQIEAVKQISLGSCPPQNTAAEVVAYRYWNYNSLSYDDKILDGFYDLYGVLAEPCADKMPSLLDLQRISVSNNISWEAILVDRSSDPELVCLEQSSLQIAVASRSASFGVVNHHLVQKLANLVAENMGKHVDDPERMSKAWRIHSNHLKEQTRNMVLPLGKLKIGLARHRALLYKVLADSVGVPCQLLKGQHFTSSDDVAINIVKLDDGREYIVDLMADPGTLIPSDAAGAQINFEEPLFRDNFHVVTSSSSASGSTNSLASCKESLSDELKPRRADKSIYTNKGGSAGPATESSGRSVSFSHARSPSWTEGVSSPAARRMQVKDVSQYMIDAAKENPQLAQKLHDVLLESGVVAPPNLFAEVYHDAVEYNSNQVRDTSKPKGRKVLSRKPQVEGLPGPILPPLPNYTKFNSSRQQLEIQKTTDGLVSPQDLNSNVHHEVSAAMKFAKNMPVAAAAAATAAVVASSMVVAVAKSNTDANIEVPMAAAAAVVATTAAVTKQYEQLESSFLSQTDWDRKSGEGSGGSGNSKHGSGNARHSRVEQDFDGTAHVDGERNSDKSTENESVKSDSALDDVAEWEILWEEITVGERIGLGSYGEVYRGEWHGTEVAIKRFLDQDISGDCLAEFGKEVRIMKRLPHPNVVLFMGAVTRSPNLSIVTEFLPRGSLYRLLHRPNNQLDERRRLRMALDVARGMNYLHNCAPIIVHRDLKSPNLLVDKNWVVKVCDFGLSKIKNTTFLSSRSNAGTAEWMAPEVLRNEPSDEKCDVYSFGVILWELTTLQQPWGGMNPMQVVGAVGFQHRRLDIPHDMDSVVADIIKSCWQTDPKLRPSFSEIMAALKPLQRPITSAQTQLPAGAPRPKIISPRITSAESGDG